MLAAWSSYLPHPKDSKIGVQILSNEDSKMGLQLINAAAIYTHECYSEGSKMGVA